MVTGLNWLMCEQLSRLLIWKINFKYVCARFIKFGKISSIPKQLPYIKNHLSQKLKIIFLTAIPAKISSLKIYSIAFHLYVSCTIWNARINMDFNKIWNEIDQNYLKADVYPGLCVVSWIIDPYLMNCASYKLRDSYSFSDIFYLSFPQRLPFMGHYVWLNR